MELVSRLCELVTNGKIFGNDVLKGDSNILTPDDIKSILER